MSSNALIVADAFKESVANAASYPQNLVERFIYSATLKAYNVRLGKAVKLLVSEESETEVAFRDFNDGTSSESNPANRWILS